MTRCWQCNDSITMEERVYDGYTQDWICPECYWTSRALR